MSMVLRLFKVMKAVFSCHLDAYGRPSSLSLSLFGWWPSSARREMRSMSDGARLALALEQLGPIFVKFGQLLSTRYDLLDDKALSHLARLQDQVAPFPSEQVIEIIERGLGCAWTEVFATLDLKPLASASVAQVHAATLKESGASVVIKVLRPNVQVMIDRDIRLMGFLLKRFGWCLPHGLGPRLLAIVSELHCALRQELDLMREASHASTLRRNFEASESLYVPRIIWSCTNAHMLVQEKVSGIRIDDLDALQKAGVDTKALAASVVTLFFTQVLRDSFFHADVHPGNVFVSVDQMAHAKIILVDFGIMGSLSPNDQTYIAANLLAFVERDYRRVASLHVASGWVAPDTRVDQFATDIRAVCEPMLSQSLRDLSFAHLLMQLLRTAQSYQVAVQPQLCLLQKTLLSVEAMARRLDPDIDLWAVAKPCLVSWRREQLSMNALKKLVKSEWPFWAMKLQSWSKGEDECVTDHSSTKRQRCSRGGMGFILGALLVAVLWWWCDQLHQPAVVQMAQGMRMV